MEGALENKIEQKESNDRFDVMTGLLKEMHVVVDTGVLGDKHAEILNNLELGVFNNEAYSIVLLDAGSERPLHIHDTSTARFYFLQGSGAVMVGEKEIPFKKGTYVEVPAGVPHGFKVETDSLFLSIQDNDGILKPDKHIDFRYK